MNTPINAVNDTLTTAFNTHHTAYKNEINPSYAVRKDRLDRMEKALRAYADRLVAAMDADYGQRSHAESSAFDVTVPIGDVRMNKHKLRKWMRPRRQSIPKHLFPAKGKVLPMPKGVVGVIAPWNFPVYLAIAPATAALAAGNRVMIKPSELTPNTSAMLKEMIEAFFTADEVTVHPGGVEVAKAFSELPFGHLLFTGSTQVGRLVAMAAAKNLTPVTLELGGKSPTIIGENADLKRAAKSVAFGKTANAGQICVAPDYVLVPKDKVAVFKQHLEESMREMYPDFTRSPDYTAMISERHQQRIQNMVKEVAERGAEVTHLADTSACRHRLETPCLVVNPPLDSQLMQEEIFGPVLPIITYDNTQQALDFVNARPSPLALYIFTQNTAERDIWLSQTLSGGVCVNDVAFHVVADTMPFGGVGESGMGAYHGKTGFDTFSHLKAVLYQPRLNGTFAFYPPIRPWQVKLAGILRNII